MRKRISLNCLSKKGLQWVEKGMELLQVLEGTELLQQQELKLLHMTNRSEWGIHRNSGTTPVIH